MFNNKEKEKIKKTDKKIIFSKESLTPEQGTRKLPVSETSNAETKPFFNSRKASKSETILKNPAESKDPKKLLKTLRLPRFGKTQLLAFVRDLKTLFTFWEVSPQTAEEAKNELKDEYKGSSMFLRIFKKQPDGTSDFLYEIVVKQGEMNRYMNLEDDGGTYFVEIARKTYSGRYLVLARSNEVNTGATEPTVPINDSIWEMPVEIREYFNDEIIEQSFEPGKKLFSADLGGHGALHRRRIGPQDRHAASRF
jgi:hypothetical protein